jgi:hypothetical protein
MKEYDFFKPKPGEKISITFLPLPTHRIKEPLAGKFVGCTGDKCPICDMLEKRKKEEGTNANGNA